ncbi:MAG: YhcN/YlaJ family sporulation lipoprotein [Peptococcaceae bacterium]|jgi:YhcN/YlaJ family sporulation lipoprotein|nr:YhcN/YlaJ family sporulation lipoprotein [Peptococcaceae bacterium]
MLTLFCLGMMTLMLVGLAACSNPTRPGAPGAAPTPSASQPFNTTDPNGANTGDENVKAQAITAQITQISDIERAQVILMNRGAWVGIRLNGQTEGSLTDERKTEVANLVKQADSSVETVYVTADADLVERIESIGKEIADGKPVSGFAAELEEIGRRITPSAR